MKRMFFFFLAITRFVWSGDYVTCEFRGQLGNQMFQVAATIGYALDNHCTPIFPGLLKARQGADNYQNVFHRLNLNTFPKVKFVLYDKEGAWPGYWTYQPIPYKHSINWKLRGFFQTEKYFKKHEEHIRNLFAPKDSLVEEIYAKYGTLLKGEEPVVAVHIRTFIPDGQDPKTNPIFSWNYFLKAIEYFPENFKFLVFSDSINWVKENFPIDIPREVYFIENNSKYFDLYMISLCDHQIVSPHSSFSWWGAWLNKNPNKVVIVRSDAYTQNTDAFPEEWIKIEE